MIFNWSFFCRARSGTPRHGKSSLVIALRCCQPRRRCLAARPADCPGYLVWRGSTLRRPIVAGALRSGASADRWGGAVGSGAVLRRSNPRTRRGCDRPALHGLQWNPLAHPLRLPMRGTKGGLRSRFEQGYPWGAFSRGDRNRAAGSAYGIPGVHASFAGRERSTLTVASVFSGRLVH